MAAKDRAYAEERKWRQQRELAVAHLQAAERTLRRVLLSRLLLIVTFLITLPHFMLAGALASGLAAAICAATLAFNVVLLTPRLRQNIDAGRTGLDHTQLRYDDAFARMLAAEQGVVEPEPARTLSEPATVVDRSEVERSEARALIAARPPGSTVGLTHCPACGESGDLSVTHHERHVVGDNETWIVCSGLATKRLWRYDPHAPSNGRPAGCSEHPPIPGAGDALIEVPELGCAGCADLSWQKIQPGDIDTVDLMPRSRVTFSCPLCGAQGHRSGLDAHDIAVPAGHERQILGESEVWIICPEPMSWTTDRWRYEWT